MGNPINGLTANESSGSSVSLSFDGTTVAIGARNANSNAGTTRIYKWNSWSWTLVGQMNGGYSVSLSSDGTTVATGAPNAIFNTGTTRIYELNVQTSFWVIKGDPINGTTATELSGYSVSLSSDGTTVAIGAPNANSNTGTTRIYNWINTSWAIRGEPINGSTTNEFSGTSVSLSSDGTTVAIGAHNAISNAGKTQIYKWNSSSWVYMWQMNGGYSVSLSSNGTMVAIGVPNDRGSTSIYRQESTIITVRTTNDC
jgi:hypothetical protein